jgi:hypothetical protein
MDFGAIGDRVGSAIQTPSDGRQGGGRQVGRTALGSLLAVGAAMITLIGAQPATAAAATCARAGSAKAETYDATLQLDDIFEADSCGSDPSWRAGGTLTIKTSLPEGDHSDQIVLTAGPGRLAGRIEVSSGPVGPFATQQDTGPVSGCRNPGKAVLVFGAVDSEIDAADSTVYGALTASPDAAPYTTSAADTVHEGINSVKGLRSGVQACAFDLSMTLPSSVRSAEGHEVGYDPTNCILNLVVTVVGSATQAPDTNAGQSGPTNPVDSINLSCLAQAPSDSCAGSEYPYSRWGYFVYYEDPVGLDVASLDQRVGWHWGNGCVHNPVTFSELADYLEETGWFIWSKNSFSDASCGSAYISAYRDFINDIFCAGTDTHLKYDRQLSMGLPNGDFRWSVQVHKSGYCAFLLDFNWIASHYE